MSYDSNVGCIFYKFHTIAIHTYRVFNGLSYRAVVKSQVHFLEPIPYEEFKDLKAYEIAELVKTRIQEKLDEVASKKRSLRK